MTFQWKSLVKPLVSFWEETNTDYRFLFTQAFSFLLKCLLQSTWVKNVFMDCCERKTIKETFFHRYYELQRNMIMLKHFCLLDRFLWVNLHFYFEVFLNYLKSYRNIIRTVSGTPSNLISWIGIRGNITFGRICFKHLTRMKYQN